MTYPYCIDFLPSWIVDGRSSRVDPWLVDRASSRHRPPGSDFRRSSRHFWDVQDERSADRDARSTGPLGPPSFSSDSSLQICLVSSCCKRSFQSPVAARHRVSVENCIITIEFTV